MPTISSSNTIAGAYGQPRRSDGVPANGFAQGAPKGACAIDTATGKLYANTGTPTATVWALIGPA